MRAQFASLALLAATVAALGAGAVAKDTDARATPGMQGNTDIAAIDNRPAWLGVSGATRIR